MYDLQLYSNEISIIPSSKFLGVEIDSNLIFKTHILRICKTYNYILLLLRSARPYYNVQTMIDLYYTFFDPHIIYGIEF